MNSLVDQSRAQADAVARAATFTLRVDARAQYAVSGIAFDERHVLTLDHTVEREDGIRVTLPDGSTAAAKVKGRDPRSNLALLAVEAALPAWGRLASEPARLGSLVFAVGRPDDQAEAAMGMVSALGGRLRLHGGAVVEEYLATDALRVPGFSGGPVVDVAGDVVGITMNAVREARSFAVGASPAWRIAGLLRESGSIRRGYLGVRSQPTPLGDAAQLVLGRAQLTGLLVVGVEGGGPAEAAGLLVGDTLVGFRGRAVAEPGDLVEALGPEVVGAEVDLEILRGGALRHLTLRPRGIP
jgi:S1-C subfamily serine protease